MPVSLDDLGWNAWFADHLAALAVGPDAVPARVTIDYNYLYRLYAAEGEIDARVAGRLKHRATNRTGMPVVGDWVVIVRQPGEDKATIRTVLPRKTRFSRRAAGDLTVEQVVAANIDVVFLVTGLDANFNLRRIERYLVLARESGARPVILLTKSDLADDAADDVQQVQALAADVPVHAISVRTPHGVDAVRQYLARGVTTALLGSSGVGKSTLINTLAGSDILRTGEVRLTDSRGRHTTSNRELILLPGGGMIIDTPGMRELQLWDVSGGLTDTFDDVEALAARCHFTTCRHVDEPRCAVLHAIAEGRLDPDRLDSYQKLQAELRDLATRRERRLQIAQKRRRLAKKR